MKTDKTRTDVYDIILDAVDRLMSLYGYKKTTIDDIAQEAGIGKGTVYLYFNSKEEIAISWIDRFNVQLREHLQVMAKSDGSPAERIHKMLVERVLFRFDQSKNHNKSLDDLLQAIKPMLFEWRKRWHEGEAKIFSDVLNEGAREGSLQFDDAYTTARSLMFATNSFLPYNLSVCQIGQRDWVVEQVERLANILLKGLLARTN